MSTVIDDPRIRDAAGALVRALQVTTGADLEAFASGARLTVANPTATWPVVDALNAVGLAGGRRLVMPAPVPAALAQTAEKAEIYSAKVQVALAPFAWSTYAIATNLAAQGEPGLDYVRALFSASVAMSVNQAVIADLENGAPTSGNDGAAWGAVAGAGWRDLVLIVNPQNVVSAPGDYAQMAAAGIPVVLTNDVGANLVVARDGVQLAIDGPHVLVGPQEPALVGQEVGVAASYSIAIGPGAVASAGGP